MVYCMVSNACKWCKVMRVLVGCSCHLGTCVFAQKKGPLDSTFVGVHSVVIMKQDFSRTKQGEFVHIFAKNGRFFGNAFSVFLLKLKLISNSVPTHVFRKSLHLLPPDVKDFKAMHQNRFWLGCTPDPAGGAYNAPPDPRAGFNVAYFLSLIHI